ncbi:MAG: NAD(P)/FAD-dependent oxidoreductase [Stappiaceae bacterium]
MKRTTTVIIGAGQSGIAMSYQLARSGVEHVVLERGQVANSWRKERWNSLRLLTPNWMNGLAGSDTDIRHPEGFTHVSTFIDRFDATVARNNSPVQQETTVLSVRPCTGGYQVQTDQGMIACNSVVMANGACALPKVPECSREIPGDIAQFTPLDYKCPSDVPGGDVLVVGASASGLQIAQELQCSGRDVTLAVGNHLRLPRRYRGADILAWMEAIGAFSVPHTDVDDLDRVRRTPSLSLIGSDKPQALDLNALQEIGVRITGRLSTMRDGKALFSGSLHNLCAAADQKLKRLLVSIDEWIAETAQTSVAAPEEQFVPTCVPDAPLLSMDLAVMKTRSIVWATGYSPDFSWLEMPVFDRKGGLIHIGGLVAPGLYAMGQPYLRSRKSTHIHGAAEDALALANHLTARLGHSVAA